MSPSRTLPLFAQLLGDDFDTLPPRLRELHGFGQSSTWHGRSTVQRGGVLAQACAMAAGLPPTLRDAATSVRFERDGETETWLRDFEGHRMRSVLCACDGLLCERLGPLQFAFALSVREHEIHWRVRKAKLFGVVPLPASWFDGVRCRERERAGRYEFLAEAALPLVGPLIRYEGWLERG